MHKSNLDYLLGMPTFMKTRQFARFRSIVKLILVNLLFILVLLEIASAVVIETGIINARKPPYSMKYSTQSFWGDINEHFGVWHPPNSKARHIRNCYDIIYTSNSYGARDIERSHRSTAPRVACLGDSFIEGMGVEREDRLTEWLEEKSGMAHLNFGTSGSFGPVQEYLLYKHLAKEFDHDYIMLGILPDNDFSDLNPDNHGKRFLPYWEGSYPDYQLKTTVDSIELSPWSRRNLNNETLCKYFLLNFTYTRNVYDYLGALYDHWRIRKSITRQNPYDTSPFADYKEEEFNKMRYSYEKIIEEAAGKKVFFFTIPRMRDLLWYRTSGISPLGEALADWAAQYPNVFFLDLLPLTGERVSEENWNELFISCDGHWSPKGHRFSAALIYEKFKDELYATDGS